MDEKNIAGPGAGHARLRRSVGLTGLVLYGLGVTIGAGIYVLVGEVVVRAGDFAPAAFMLSALVMGFTAGSFAELCGRVPKAAGEAVYIETAFGLPWLTVVVGLAVLVEAMIAAAAIAVGASGYVAELIPLPPRILVAVIVIVMAGIAAWGIRETVAIAGAMTIVEIAGLLVIIAAGIASDPDALAALPASLAPPPGNWAAVTGVFAASLIAFFAFIGFDDVVNLVEEAHDPRNVMPWAIGLTLLIVTVFYVLVSFVAARMIPVEDLAGTAAPISLLFERLTGLSPLTITLIAILATMNGVGIILVMAARVAYGMAKEGRLPAWIGAVSPRTRTPLRATILVTGVVLALALFTPLGILAKTTSEVLLGIFLLVNLALVRLKIKGVPAPDGTFTLHVAFPIAGVGFCLFLLLSGLFIGG